MAKLVTELAQRFTLVPGQLHILCGSF